MRIWPDEKFIRTYISGRFHYQTFVNPDKMGVIQSHHVHKVLEIVTLIYPEMINIWSQCQAPVGFFREREKNSMWRRGVCLKADAFDIYQTTGQH